MPRDVPCRFDGCKLTFDGQDALIEHMIDEPDHDYCEKCDETCTSWEDYLRHMVQSDRHIACPDCGKEFKSLSGLERHVKLDHRTKQSLVCLGCQFKFSSAGDLVGHLEKGMCRNSSRPQDAISKLKFQDHINQKTIINQMLNEDSLPTGNPARTAPSGPGSTRSIQSSSTSTSTTRGGVPVSNHLDAPEPGPSSWPSLTDNGNSVRSDDDAKVDKVTDSVFTVNLNGAWSKPLTASNVSEIEDTASRASSIPSSTSGPNDWNTRFWNPRSKAWDPNKFWNAFLQIYECPHKGCNFSDTSVTAFQSHCYDSHKPTIYRCPACLREYKNLQALLQHCESSTTRCKIRHSRDYSKFVDLVTGGFVNASQRNNKGEVMYQMTRPNDFAEQGFW